MRRLEFISIILNRCITRRLHAAAVASRSLYIVCRLRHGGTITRESYYSLAFLFVILCSSNMAAKTYVFRLQRVFNQRMTELGHTNIFKKGAIGLSPPPPPYLWGGAKRWLKFREVSKHSHVLLFYELCPPPPPLNIKHLPLPQDCKKWFCV